MRDLGKLIVTKGFKKLPKVQKIAQSGHTARAGPLPILKLRIQANSDDLTNDDQGGVVWNLRVEQFKMV